MAEVLELQAYERAIIGRQVKTIRKEGWVPGILYGHGITSKPIKVKEIDLERVIRSGAKTRLLTLKIEGDKRPKMVLMREVQRDPVKLSLQHVDFQAVRMGEKLRLEVPLRLVGESPMVTTNEAILLQVLDRVEVECLPQNIPQHLEVDVSSLDSLEKVVQVKDISLPEGVEVLAEPEEVVANLTLSAARLAAEEEEEAAAAEAEAAEVEVVAKGKAAKEGEEEAEEE